MKSMLAILFFVSALLSGCADYQSTNEIIAQSNEDRFATYKDGMIGCAGDAACKVGLSMAFAGNIGNQEFFKPESARDYMIAGLPYAQIAAQIYGGAVSTGSGSGIVVKGNNNTFSGVNNKVESSGESTTTFSPTATQSNSTEINVGNEQNVSASAAGEGTATAGPPAATDEVIVETPAETEEVIVTEE